MIEAVMGERTTGPSEDPQGPRDGRQGPEGEGDAAAPESRGQGATRNATPLTQQIGRVVLLVLLVLFGIFAATNAQPVDFSWVFGGTEVTQEPTGETSGGVPLIVLLLLSFVIGAVVGGGAAWQSTRARRRTRDEEHDG
jgi:uncharacterized integral membrane protein